MGDALAASYRAFDGRLPFGARPAVLLIDMVRAYLDPDCPLHIGQAAEDAITAAAALAEAARTAGAPVIFTNVSFRPDGRDGGLFYRKVPVLSAFHEGATTGAFDPRLQPEATDLVVTKHYASAYFGTSLASTLNALGIDTAVIAGFSTSGCVRATALDTLQHGFVPYVVRDACADRHSGPHEANLFDLQAKYAEVVGLEDALAKLAGA